ncbi:hypothetical protein QVD17_31668 [Tagetes erecta]|uniref:Uncharacterized protein n=1 Tax=Tagetes erecta TaxID=13708 RepID=A0AAD8K3V5_TARER|nr:hypothetical protein QVD17_31668 [Tagetes erecta]
MALCEDECFLVRRFAAGGIDKNIGDSHAGGKDRYSICRVAARGSNGVYPDPRDLKIKRLQKRVQDLEVSSTWKETKPEEPVEDELTGDEEHPTIDDIIYDSSPLYDEYEDEDWYAWFTGGVRERLEEHGLSTISFGMFDNFFHMNPLMVGGGSVTSANRNDNPLLVTIRPQYVENLNIEKEHVNNLMGFKTQVEDNNTILLARSKGYLNFKKRITVKHNDRNCDYFVDFTNTSKNQVARDDSVGPLIDRVFKIVSGLTYRQEGLNKGSNLNYGCVVKSGGDSMMEEVRRDDYYQYYIAITISSTAEGLNFLFDKHRLLDQSSIQHEEIRDTFSQVFKFEFGIKRTLRKNIVRANLSSKAVDDFFDVIKTRGRVFFKEGKKESRIGGPANPIDPRPVDPSFTSNLSKWGMITISKKRLDVPFDPGGVDLELKLEDEFFEEGENDTDMDPS